MYGFMGKTWELESRGGTLERLPTISSLTPLSSFGKTKNEWVYARAKIGLIGYSHLHSLATIANRLGWVTRLTLEWLQERR